MRVVHQAVDRAQRFQVGFQVGNRLRAREGKETAAGLCGESGELVGSGQAEVISSGDQPDIDVDVLLVGAGRQGLQPGGDVGNLRRGDEQHSPFHSGAGQRVGGNFQRLGQYFQGGDALWREAGMPPAGCSARPGCCCG